MLKALKWVVFLLSLMPFLALSVGAVRNTLGPDPADVLVIQTGLWALRFLLMSLAISPLRSISGWTWVVPYRRTFGLFSLYYACWHMIAYLLFFLQLRWSELYEDIVERPYITVGFTALLILIALGATSNKRMIRRLGRRWKKLHRLVYIASVLALLHLFWILRTDLAEAVFYGSILVPLLAYRLYQFLVARTAKVGKAARPGELR